MRKCLLTAAALCLMAWPAAGQDVAHVVVFGDSLSDPGNIPLLTGGLNYPPSPPYAGNRFSNGPVYAELLPGFLGLTFDQSLNFATGGALTGVENLGNERIREDPSLDGSGIVLPGIQTQVDEFIAEGGQLDDHDLVIVFGGANDVFVAADVAETLPVDKISALIQTTVTTAVGNLSESVLKLNAAGGERFILPNLPDLGAIPSTREQGPAIRALGTAITVAHNLALRKAARELRDQTGAEIMVFNVNAVFAAMRARPQYFGLTNTTDACLDTPSCAAGDVETQNQFLFFDGVHPTASAHQKTAKILAEAIKWGQMTTSRDMQSRIISRRW